MQQYHLIRYPGCKWNKHIAIMNDPKLKDHIPQTSLLTKESFLEYIERFPVVFLKPSLGGGGKGIMKVVTTKRSYNLYFAIYRKSFSDKHLLYNYVKQRYRKRKYIIQQGVDLIQVASRHIDFRAVVLKIEGHWQFMGIIGKSAPRRKFVTNHTSGGKVMRFKQALQHSLRYSNKQCDSTKQTIRSLSLHIAHALNKKFPNITELGLDIAIDKHHNIWLLEANTKPHFNLFKSHEDQALHGKIIKHTKKLRSLPSSSLSQ